MDVFCLRADGRTDRQRHDKLHIFCIFQDNIEALKCDNIVWTIAQHLSMLNVVLFDIMTLLTLPICIKRFNRILHVLLAAFIIQKQYIIDKVCLANKAPYSNENWLCIRWVYTINWSVVRRGSNTCFDTNKYLPSLINDQFQKASKWGKTHEQKGHIWSCFAGFCLIFYLLSPQHRRSIIYYKLFDKNICLLEM